MSKDDTVRIEIGYEGGHVTGAVVQVSSADSLEKQLVDGDAGVAMIDAEDSTISVVLSQVAYVRRFARDGRLGFGG
jgi:hypothetical protein